MKTKKNLAKKLLSLALAFAMVFGVMPAMEIEVEAAGETIEVLDFTLAHNDDGTYTISNVTVPADKVLVFGVPTQRMINELGGEAEVFEYLETAFNNNIGQSVGNSKFVTYQFDTSTPGIDTPFSIGDEEASRMYAGVVIAICSEKDEDDNYTIYEMGMTAPVAEGTTGGNLLGKETYTVTFDPNNGEATPPVTVASSMVIPTPTWDSFHFTGWYNNAELTGTALTNDQIKALAADVTLYAKWTNNGKIVRTTPIEIDADTATVNNADEGWAWDATSKTLTLNGLTMDVFGISEDAFAISLSFTNDAINVILADGSTNSVTSSARGIDSAHRTTTFNGKGSLTTDTVGMGIAGTFITIEEGTYNLTSGHQTISLNQLTVNDATLNVETTGQQSAIHTGSQVIINGGEVTATAPSGKAAILGSVDTSEGTPTIKAGVDAANANDTTYTGQSYVNIKFTPTVTFDPNNGEATTPVEIPETGSITVPADPTWGNYTFADWYDNEQFTGNALTDDEIKALDTSTTLYAKWTNNGKIVRTTSIEIDADTATVNNADEGWAWDATSKTLTLDGLTMDVVDDTPYWAIDIGVSGDTFVELTDGSSNSITGKSGITYTGNAIYRGEGSLTTVTESICIYGPSITFDGGIYNFTSTRADEVSAIMATNLTVNGGTINATLPNATNDGYTATIFYRGDFYLNGGEVTATAKTGVPAIATEDDNDVTIKTNTTLTIKAGADAANATDTTYTGQPYVYAKAQGVAVSTTTVEGRMGDDLGDLTARVVGMGNTVSYQWYSNTADSNENGTAISGANSVAYPLPSDLVEGTYYYYVTATSTEGTFTSAVTTVTVKPALTDAEAVAEAKKLIEDGEYTFTQSTANTEDEAKIEIARQINDLAGMSETGVTITVADITISEFDDAAGGTDGIFNFTVALEKGEATAEATAGATITATPVQNISGKIVDENGDGVEDAVVTIGGKTATTGADGSYTIADIPHGIYTVTVTTGSGGADEKTQTSSVTVNDDTMDDIVFVTEGNKNTTITVATVGGAPPTTADNLENMFDGNESDTDDVEIELKVAKTTEPADKEEIDFAIVGQNALGMYLDIELLKTTTPAGGTPTAENIQPPSGQKVTITIQLPAAHRNKAPYHIIHVHNGVTEIIQAVYNSYFHTLTFEASKFSTYAYTYTDLRIITHTLTVEEVGTDGTVGGDYADGNILNINAGTKDGYTFTGWTSVGGGTFANENSANTTFTMPEGAVTITANWSANSTGGGSSGSQTSYTELEYEYWAEVKDSIEGSQAGDTIKVEANNFDRMPWTVMELLHDYDVNIVIDWNGGETILIPSGEAQDKVQGRIYWPLSMLEDLYNEATFDDAVMDDKINPSSGGILPGGSYSNVISAPLQSTPQSQTVDSVAVTPPTAGFEADAFAGTEDAVTATTGQGNNSAYIAMLMLAAISGIAVYVIYRKRTEDAK